MLLNCPLVNPIHLIVKAQENQEGIWVCIHLENELIGISYEKHFCGKSFNITMQEQYENSMEDDCKLQLVSLEDLYDHKSSNFPLSLMFG